MEKESFSDVKLMASVEIEATSVSIELPNYPQMMSDQEIDKVGTLLTQSLKRVKIRASA